MKIFKAHVKNQKDSYRTEKKQVECSRHVAGDAMLNSVLARGTKFGANDERSV
jgi:hypothetical protein